MELKDLIVTPIYLLLIYLVAYLVRNRFTTPTTRRYFIPALTLKIAGAIALGIIYQFYYGWGDTFTYFHVGSRYVWEAFLESPVLAFKLIFAGAEYDPDTFYYASRIYTYGDLPSYFVVRVAGFFDILTFHTYSATAVLFSIVSFTGVWALFNALCRLYPALNKRFALAVFFVPSVFFWGSGLLKDSITLGAVGWLVYAVVQFFFMNKRRPAYIILALISLYILYVVKIYILLCIMPAIIIWLFLSFVKRIKSTILRVVVGPMVFAIALISGFYAIISIGQSNAKYSFEQLAGTAEETARWLNYVGEVEGGSVYDLGDFDYTPAGMLRKFPLAVWVTLFRPYPWEAYNPVMMLSALESAFMLALTVIIFVRCGVINVFRYIFSNPFVLFCMVFAISFSFAVGVSTYNFGSLVRYKIPMVPFYLSALYIIKHYAKRPKKVASLAMTE